MKEFILQNMFYLYGVFYILYSFYLIIKKIIDKKNDDVVDVDINNLISSLVSIITIGAGVTVASIVWIIIGCNNENDLLEKIYFIALLVFGFIIPFINNTIQSSSFIPELKETGNVEISKELLQKLPNYNKQKILYILLLFSEIVIVFLILKNHFLF